MKISEAIRVGTTSWSDGLLLAGTRELNVELVGLVL